MDQKLTAAKPSKRWRKWLVLIPVLGLVIWIGYSINPSPRYVGGHTFGGRGASNGLAPAPDEFEEAIIQIYGASTWGAKGMFAIHTWIAIKEEGATSYRVSQIVGWAQDASGSSLFTQPAIPDKSWYGNPPKLLLDIRGEKAKELLPKVKQAIESYPWKEAYQLWPGPNSNTFVAWIGLQVPELGLDLPAKAIGKDWRPLHQLIGQSVSGTGVQTSLLGLLGFSIGYQEGVEINILGLNIELDLFDLAIELPIVGRIGKDQV